MKSVVCGGDSGCPGLRGGTGSRHWQAHPGSHTVLGTTASGAPRGHGSRVPPVDSSPARQWTTTEHTSGVPTPGRRADQQGSKVVTSPTVRWTSSGNAPSLDPTPTAWLSSASPSTPSSASTQPSAPPHSFPAPSAWAWTSSWADGWPRQRCSSSHSGQWLHAAGSRCRSEAGQSGPAWH